MTVFGYLGSYVAFAVGQRAIAGMMRLVTVVSGAGLAVSILALAIGPIIRFVDKVSIIADKIATITSFVH